MSRGRSTYKHMMLLILYAGMSSSMEKIFYRTPKGYDFYSFYFILSVVFFSSSIANI